MLRNDRAGSPGEFAEADAVGISWIIRRTRGSKATHQSHRRLGRWPRHTDMPQRSLPSPTLETATFLTSSDGEVKKAGGQSVSESSSFARGQSSVTLGLSPTQNGAKAGAFAYTNE